MNLPLDYEKFGRQIALPELGVDGQRAIASRPVRFLCSVPSCVHDAERIWSSAGGIVATERSIDPLLVEINARAANELEPAIDSVSSMALGAWAALDAARVLLRGAHESPPPRPAALDAALIPPQKLPSP